jgi:hypothetical protein
MRALDPPQDTPEIHNDDAKPKHTPTTLSHGSGFGKTRKSRHRYSAIDSENDSATTTCIKSIKDAIDFRATLIGFLCGYARVLHQ